MQKSRTKKTTEEKNSEEKNKKRGRPKKQENTMAQTQNTPGKTLEITLAATQTKTQNQPAEKPEKHTTKEKRDKAATEIDDVTENKKTIPMSEKHEDIFKTLIQARKEAETRLREQEKQYSALLSIADIAEKPGQIEQQLQYSRLLASEDQEKLHAALKLLDEQKAAILSQLGRQQEETPLFPDAYHREKQSSYQPDPSPFPENTQQQWENTITAKSVYPEKKIIQGNLHDLIQALDAYFRLYNNEPGHSIKIQHIHKYFRDPAKLNEFLSIYEPAQWASQFKYMYDNIIIPKTGYNEDPYQQEEEHIIEEQNEGPLSTLDMIRRNMEKMGL